MAYRLRSLALAAVVAHFGAEGGGCHDDVLREAVFDCSEPRSRLLLSGGCVRPTMPVLPNGSLSRVLRLSS